MNNRTLHSYLVVPICNEFLNKMMHKNINAFIKLSWNRSKSYINLIKIWLTFLRLKHFSYAFYVDVWLKDVMKSTGLKKELRYNFCLYFLCLNSIFLFVNEPLMIYQKFHEFWITQYTRNFYKPILMFFLYLYSNRIP